MVLMDLDMPVMDGYQATEMIRKLGNEKYQLLPIIAVTASVLSDAKESVLAAGMNDFIGKPFNPYDLFLKMKDHTKTVRTIQIER